MQASSIPATSALANTRDVPLERIAANSKLDQNTKLEAACRAFEAVLLRQILDSAQKVVIPSSGSPDSASASVYRDMVTSQMADQIAASGQFGLAQSFLSQIRTRTGSASTEAKPSAAPTSGSATRSEPGPSPTSPLPSDSTLKPFRSAPVPKAYRHE